MKVANIESVLAQLMALRDSWKAIWNDAKLVASSLQIELKLFRDRSTTARKRIRFYDEDTPDENVNEMNKADKSPEEGHFRKHILYVLLDNVIGGLTVCFSAAKVISATFSFLWNYQKTKRKADELADEGSKRHSLQAVELSQRTQAAVQIVSNLPAPSNGGPIYRFFGHACHADPLDGWRCCSQKWVMSRPIQVRQL